MKKLTGNEVRRAFLEFFESKGHMIEPSASLVPINDPSLLWINAGVAALKKYFDGREKPRVRRICNAQKCIRTNDIENVGKTARHHTFFEMLGNFSIGDYFKEDALKYAWEFLTSEKWLGLDKEKLYVTVYIDDDEAYRIWTQINNVSPSHILKTADNFWQIGEGPCGPDSEIFYDRGEKYDPEGLGEKLFFEEMENDRYVEVWNVVFSQYDAKEGVDRKDFKELPQKNIDTGMGLERLVSIIQDGETNFDTDLFLPIIEKTKEYSKMPYEAEHKMAYRVIADHIRTVTFALADGATFSNEGRGYVLRRVLRRACRYGRSLGIQRAFMYELVDTVCMINENYYPYLRDKKDMIKKLIRKEEEMFLETLSNGEKLLDDALKNVKDNILDGEVIFKLYDTYGFPKEITVEIAQDRGIKCDLEGFKRAMQHQKEMARSSRASLESMHNQSEDLLSFKEPFVFIGYTDNFCKAEVTGIFKDGEHIEKSEDICDVAFDKSPFYAESGGQVADSGIVENDHFKAEVSDVKKAPNGQFLHRIKVIEGCLKKGDSVDLRIDVARRNKIRANHSSLHLLQSALIKILGDHVRQAGSYVCDSYARFDFTHFEKIADADLKKIEKEVNSYIMKALPVKTVVYTDIEEAKKQGAIALFDEKYEDKVRVVTMGDVSKEFCGGTHVNNTQDLGVFKIRYEESIGSGIRRIECVTKMVAYEDFASIQNTLEDLALKLGLKGVSSIGDKVESLLLNIDELRHENIKLKTDLLQYQADELIDKAKIKDGRKYLFLKLENSDVKLKDFAMALKNKLKDGLVFIANVADGKVTFVCTISEGLIKDGHKAGDIIKKACALTNGKGGGRNDVAQGGGQDLGNIDEVLQTIEKDIMS